MVEGGRSLRRSDSLPDGGLAVVLFCEQWAAFSPVGGVGAGGGHGGDVGQIGADGESHAIADHGGGNGAEARRTRALARSVAGHIVSSAHREWNGGEASRRSPVQTSDQRPITRLDFELLPHVWRDPDAVRPGEHPGDLIFEKALLGRTVFATWQTPGRAVELKTLYVKR
jgi:hypothetical protein